MWAAPHSGRQAEADFARARGTAHRMLLEASRRQVEVGLRQQEDKGLRLRRELETLERQHQAELRAALELYFVRDRFNEVPGWFQALVDGGSA